LIYSPVNDSLTVRTLTVNLKQISRHYKCTKTL